VRTASTNDEAIAQLGSRLIEEFVTRALEHKSEPLIVYLPSRSHFAPNGVSLQDRVGEILATRKIHLQNMTPCVAASVSIEQLFLDGKPHYSAEGNEAVAKCLQPLIAKFLQN